MVFSQANPGARGEEKSHAPRATGCKFDLFISLMSVIIIETAWGVFRAIFNAIALNSESLRSHCLETSLSTQTVTPPARARLPEKNADQRWAQGLESAPRQGPGAPDRRRQAGQEIHAVIFPRSKLWVSSARGDSSPKRMFSGCGGRAVRGHTRSSSYERGRTD